jgi:tRNA dimethylallyltransferase
MSARIPVLVITGPTGSGKTQLALELATRLPLEIVNMDSAQVYRGLDIGTAKPDAPTRERIPHHLIDIRDAALSYSVGEFVRDAREQIEAIQSRNHIPALVGGTLLYLRALRRGLAVLPEADPATRAALDARAAHSGWPALHAELAAVDAVAAARIHPNDGQRIQRALEVHQLTGHSISSLQAATRGLEDRYEWLGFALLPADRAAHQAALRARFQSMLDAGLLQEVQKLHRRGDLTERHPAVRSVGYRQLWRYIEGHYSLAAAIEAANVATSQLAKRQLTWLRSEPGLVMLDPLQPSTSKEVISSVARSVSSVLELPG